MNYYVISYDLHVKKDYEKVKECIDRLSLDWIKPLESFFLVKTNFDAAYLRDALRKSTDYDDSFIVIRLNINEWDSYGINKQFTDRLYTWKD